MYNNAILISLPKQDLLRPPGALPILAAACEELTVDYQIADFNLWLYNNVQKDIWQQIDDNWDKVNPLDSVDQEFYKVFLTKLAEFVDLILKTHPDLIAISVFADNGSVCALELIKLLNKSTRSNYNIAIGGSGIRAKINSVELCTTLLEQGQIDYFLFGEGELTFRQLLKKQTDYPGINNFNIKQIDDLDQFPFPSYTKISPSDYQYIATPEVIITGSRGCVRKCTYCDVAKYWPKFRYRGGQNIADELYHYYKFHNITNFEFSDSLINGSLKQFKEMNLAILEYQKLDPGFKISYKGQYICRGLSAMKEIDYINMKNAGCDYVYVGVESFSDSVRFAMDKKFTNEDLDEHLKMCGRHGISNSFLMLVGYPTETLADHQKNLDTLHKYQHYALSGVISMIVFGYTSDILDDTPLHRMQGELGIVPEFNSANDTVGSNWISLQNPSLTLYERIRRWVELTELATDLNYRMPRFNHYVNKFVDLLEKTKDKKIQYQINKQPSSSAN